MMNLWQTMLISSIVPTKQAPKPWATILARNLCLAFFFVASYVCLASGNADRTISKIRTGNVLVVQHGADLTIKAHVFKANSSGNANIY